MGHSHRARGDSLRSASPALRKPTEHDLRVPHPNDVFVLVVRVGYLEPRRDWSDLPAQQCGANGESGAHGSQQHQVAFLQLALLDGGFHGQRDGAR